MLAPANAAVTIDGLGGDWQSSYFQISDGSNDIGASFDSGYEIIAVWAFYEGDKLLLRMDVKGIPGDADGDGDIDTGLPTDQPGVGINEIYRFRIDKDKDGTWDITVEYSNNGLHVYGIPTNKVAFAYEKIVEASISDIASLGINPASFRLFSYAGTSLDGLPEDTVPQTDVDLSPRLQLTKTVDVSEATPGDTLTYTINYLNNGFSEATGVVIEDTLPEHTTYVSGGTLSGTKATWNVGSLVPGQSGSVTLKVKIDSPLDDDTVIRNVATIDSDQTSPTTSPAETTVHSSPLLTITKTDGPDPVPVNSELTYTITYSNSGTMNATNVVIKESYPQEVTFVSASPAPNVGNDEWHLATLPVGSSGTITITVAVGNVSEGTVLTNKATISSDQTQPQEAATTTTVFSVLLSLAKSDAPDPVNAGQNITYTIFYSNEGSLSATNIVITETYDPQTTFVSSVPAPDAGGTNVFTIGTLAAGASGTISVVVRVSPTVPHSASVVNTVTLDSSETEPLSATVETGVVSLPILSIDKEVDKASAKSGEQLGYTITIANNGTADATGVTIVDTVPSGTSLVAGSVTGGGAGSPVITWNVGTLAPGQTKVVGFKVKIDSEFTGAIVNMATLDSDQTEPVTDNAITNVNAYVLVDILLSPPTQTKEISKCGTAVFPITVKNRGTLADTIALTFTQPPPTWTASLDRTKVTLDPGASTVINLTTSSCLEYGRISIGVTGRSGNDTAVTSSVTTLTIIRSSSSPTPSGPTGVSGATDTSKFRQNLIITNVKSGDTYFLKNSMSANSIEVEGNTLALQVDVVNRGMRTAHDVTLSFKGFTDFTVSPAKQDILGGKTVRFDVTLTFSGFPESLTIFADGLEDDSGTYRMKLKPPPPAPEPAVVKPTLAPIVPPTPTPQQTSAPTLAPLTPEPTAAPTMAPEPRETPAPASEPGFFVRARERVSDALRASAFFLKGAALYIGAGIFTLASLILMFTQRHRIWDYYLTMKVFLTRTRIPRTPAGRPKPSPARPARNARGIPGRKHKFVLETDGP